MDFIIDHLLSLILFIPVAGAVIITLLPKDQVGAIRWVALITTLFPLGLSLVLWTRFDSHAAGFQFV